jgi:two-component system sensor histidine kinase BarA
MKIGWLHKGGIGQRTMLIIAIPLLMTVLFLGYQVTVTYLTDTRYAAYERGTLLAKHLAVLSEFGMFSTDRIQLAEYAEAILREPGVISVSIEDNYGEVLANAGNTGTARVQEDLILFSAPITRSGVDVLDFEEEAINDTGNQVPDMALGRVHVSLSRDLLYAREVDILFIGTVATISALLASLLLAYLVSRGISTPVERLTRTVEKLTGGNLSVRTNVTSPGELGELERGINQMASSLQAAQKELTRQIEDATSALRSTVETLEVKNRELDLARKEALRAGEAKSEFLAKMSHEIRTPLSAVIGFSRLIENSEKLEDRQEYTNTIKQAAMQLITVIDDILDISRLESGAYRFESDVIDLQECLENVVAILSATAHEKGLELVLYMHADVQQNITADGNRISQVLTNLVSNAIKFTASGHVIVEVSLEHPDSEEEIIRIEVTDTGIGLSETEAAHIFEPFTQADASTNRKFGGTGLGLSISKKLVELMGGEIGVKHMAGKGSTFWFTLPVPRADEAETTRHTPLASERVLVYDPNAFSRRALRNRFFAWGATVFNTSDSKKLLEMLNPSDNDEDEPSLLVLGLSVEQSNEKIVRKVLDEIRHISSTPVLILTSCEPCINKPGEFDSKTVQVLAKPPRSERMLRAVEQLLEKTGLNTQPLKQPAPNESVAGDTNNLTGLRVLAAEDNRFNRMYLQKLLSGMGLSVTLAEDGKTVCDYASRELYGIIFMDIHMPEMGGIQATREIHAGKNRQTPVIALTADVFANENQDLKALGFSDILYKPITEEELIDIINRWTQLSPGGIRREPPAANESMVAVPPELLPKLAEEVTAQLQSLRAACQAGDQARMKDHAHQMKGLTDYFKFGELKSGLQQLQEAIIADDPDSITMMIDAIESSLGEVFQSEN